MVPQDTEPTPVVHAINHPPIIDVSTVFPTDPVVTVNKQCPSRNTFQLGIIDLDVDQPLAVRWLIDYDLSGQQFDPPIVEYTIPPNANGDPMRFAELAGSDLDLTQLTLGKPATLEAFVVETGALAPDSRQPPYWQKLRDCKAAGYPTGCIPSHPAVFRWTLDVKDQVCE